MALAVTARVLLAAQQHRDEHAGQHHDVLDHEQGAEVLHEPREWPEYHPTYYGGFVRDPDGNNVEAVCHTPE